MIIDEAMYLEHHGVKGQKWGVRNEIRKLLSDHKGSPTPSSQKKQPPKSKGPKGWTPGEKHAVEVAAGVAFVGALTIATKGKDLSFLKKGVSAEAHLSAVKAAEAASKEAAKPVEEPTGVVHFARGKNKGLRFLSRGGLTNPTAEHIKGFGDETTPDNLKTDTHRRYGTNNEKIAVRFTDPENRRDASGRRIVHDVILPEEHAKDLGSNDTQVIRRAWKLVRPDYNKFWEESLKNRWE